MSVAEPVKPESYQRVLDIVMKEDDLNWKDLILNLVREEGMDPWNIDVSRLAQQFLVMLNELKKTDFRISGKMVLAASLLLKIKSDRLLLDDLAAFDQLLAEPQEQYDDLFEDDVPRERFDINQFLDDQKRIVPRTPQPRERQVSVFDLVNALEQALATDARRQNVLARTKGQETEQVPQVPRKVFDLGQTMASMQDALKGLFAKKKTKIYFHDLLKSKEKEDVVYTFLPLLHLENQRKVEMNQEEHFGDIEVVIYHQKLDEQA